MHILVTGGAGYIGSHTVRALLEQGHTPVVLDNLIQGLERFVPQGTPFINGDVGDAHCLAQVFASYPIQAVIHFAGSALVAESVTNPGKYLQNNTQASLTLLQAMNTAGVKQLVFSSTCATYGVPPEGQLISEDTPQKPINPYGYSKLLVEHLIDFAVGTMGLKAVCLRYFNACGAHPSGELYEHHTPETHLIPLVLQAALGKKEAITNLWHRLPHPRWHLCAGLHPCV